MTNRLSCVVVWETVLFALGDPLERAFGIETRLYQFNQLYKTEITKKKGVFICVLCFENILPCPMSLRKLKHHEQKLLKKVDFLNWKKEQNLREIQVLRRYHIQDREDYVKYVEMLLLAFVTFASQLIISPNFDADITAWWEKLRSWRVN